MSRDLKKIQNIYNDSFGKSILIGYDLISLRNLTSDFEEVKSVTEKEKIKIEIKNYSQSIQLRLVEIEKFLHLSSFEGDGNDRSNSSKALELNREIQNSFEVVISKIESSYDEKNKENISESFNILLSKIKSFDALLQQMILNYNDSVEMENARITKYLLIGFFLSLAVTFFVSIFLGKNVSTPIRLVESMAARFAEGDLTIKAPIHSKDEIGSLAKAFEQAANNLRSLVSSIQGTSKSVADTSENLSLTSKRIADGSSNQAASLEEIASAITELVESVENVSQSAEDQSKETAETIQFMSELAHGIEDIGAKSLLVDKGAKTMLSVAEIGKMNVDESVKRMADIFESSGKISQIVTVINEISSQTNLLALNAAIEAARAGDSGRGFAVVADEISKLATRSQQATKQIDSLIKESMQRVELGKEKIETLVLSFSQVLESSKESANLASEISNLTSSQNEKSGKVMMSVTHLTNLSNFIAEATSQQNTSAREIGNAVDQVNNIAQSSASSSQDLALTTVQLSKLADHLTELIMNFKTSA